MYINSLAFKKRQPGHRTFLEILCKIQPEGIALFNTDEGGYYYYFSADCKEIDFRLLCLSVKSSNDQNDQPWFKVKFDRLAHGRIELFSNISQIIG